MWYDDQKGKGEHDLLLGEKTLQLKPASRRSEKELWEGGYLVTQTQSNPMKNTKGSKEQSPFTETESVAQKAEPRHPHSPSETKNKTKMCLNIRCT